MVAKDLLSVGLARITIDSMKHAFVLGSGIAGIATAEVLTRNGWAVTILEKYRDFGGDASRNTQNWLHTGWLYAGLPDTSAMIGCNKAMRLFDTYQKMFGEKKVNMSASDCGIEFTPSNDGWFVADNVQYLYAMSTSEFPFGTSFAWSEYVEKVILKRLKSLSYNVERVTEIDAVLLDLMRMWEGREDGDKRYMVVKSTDAMINTRLVMSDLVSTMGNMVGVVTEADYELSESCGITSVSVNGDRCTPDLVVMASGSGLSSMLKGIGCDEYRKFKSVQSPIVVLDRALNMPSFIRYTPVLEHTVNHIRYKTGSVERSTIGSYDFFDVGSAPDIEPFVRKVCSRMGLSRDMVIGSYYGTKTEMSGQMSRKYNHAVGFANKNSIYAIAGKFSQFPLLAFDFAELTGLRFGEPNNRVGENGYVVAETVPERIVSGGWRCNRS